MSEVIMKEMPTKQETGTAIFSDDVKTEQKSALFMKKLLAVAVSHITYLRGIYPERAYGDRCLEDLKLKILREESSCPGAGQLIKWVKGCFDALDKKFLRVLILGIYTDPGNPETVVESYSFKFSYTDDNTGMDVYRNDKKISSSYTAVDMMRAAANLLRLIVVVINSLKVLPPDVKMTMKLLYYDDVTPNDYEPPGFKAAEYNTFHFDEEPINFKVGDLTTPFHTVQLKIKTADNQFLSAQEEESAENNTTVDENMEERTDGMVEKTEGCDLADNRSKSQSVRDLNVPQPSIADQVPTCPGPNKPEEQAVDTTGSQSSQFTADGDNGVRCQCGCNEDDGLMILCGKCRFWQHGICYKILDDEEAPERHICALCAGTVAKLQSTDPSLHDLTDIALQATCLWRRTLLFCTEVKEVLTPAMAKRFGVDIVVARGLVKRLEKENFIKANPKKKRSGMIVDKEKLKAGIQKFFKKTEMATDCTMESEDQVSHMDHGMKKSGAETSNNDIDQVTAQAEALDISEKEKVTKEEKTQDSQLRKRNKKRGKLTMDGQEYEYELGDNQDLSQEGVHSRKRRKKASIVATP